MNMEKTFSASIVRLFMNGENDALVVGTGFLVGTKYVLTCAHVVAQALRISEETKDLPSNEVLCLDFPTSFSRKKLTACVINWHPPQSFSDLSLVSAKDIAVLELNEVAPHDTLSTHFTLPTTENRSGHQFFTYGFPHGYNQGVSATGELRTIELNGWMQLEVNSTTGIPIEPGFSGAPVWDKDDGGVVGMIVEVERREGIRVAFAIPTKILSEAWPELNDYIDNDLSPIAEELMRYFQQLQESLSWLPDYYPRGFSFDHIRQRIRMKQQISTLVEDEMQNEESSDSNHENTIESKGNLKVQEQAYSTRAEDANQSLSTVVDWETIRAEGARAGLKSELSEKAKKQTKSIVVDWETIRNEVKRVVLLGDPGSGKSWLLKYEGRILAREQQEKLRQGYLRQDEVVLPIFLRLGSFAEEITSGNSNVLELILSFLKREYQLSEQFLLYVKRWLIETQCLLLLDALDEVAEDRRIGMREALRQLSENSGCRILLTSRIIGYRGVPFARKGGKWKQELELVAFAQEQIENFIDRWFSGHMEYSQHLLSTLSAEPPLRLLAGIPLLLSFLCLATALCDTIPTRRAELYETVMRLLLEASWRNDTPEGSLTSHVEEKQALLELVAWHFAGLDGRWHDIMTAGELEKVVERWAQIQHFDDAKFSQSILKELIEKDAILVKIGASQRKKQKEKVPYLFLHRTFHEYLVARYLANLSIDQCLQLIRPHFWFDADWEVVILLLTGCLEDPNPLLIALLNEVDDVFHSMLLLAGRCLIEANKTFVKRDLKDTIIGRLFSLLYSPAERDRAQVIPVLAKMGEAVVDKLLLILGDQTYEVSIYPSEVRETAAEILGQMNHPRVIPGLTNVLQNTPNDDITIYQAAAKALGRINNQQSAQALIHAFKPDISGFKRPALLNALGQMNDPLAVEMLERKLLEESKDRTRKTFNNTIIRKLSTIGNAQALDVLLKILQSSYRSYEGLLALRQQVARYLSLISDSKHKDFLLSLLNEEPTLYQALRHTGEPRVDAWLNVVQRIHSKQESVYRCWETAWKVDWPDDEVVDLFLEAVWNNPQRYQPLLSMQKIVSWTLGQTSDVSKRDEHISKLKLLDEKYDNEYIKAINADSTIYQNKSSEKGLLMVLESMTDSEIDQYSECIQSWILAQISVELMKAKQVEERSLVLANNIVNALGEIGGREVLELLIALLHFERKDLWNDAFQGNLIRALGNIGGSEAVKILVEILHDSIQEREWMSYNWDVPLDEKNEVAGYLFSVTVGTLGKMDASQTVEPLLTILQETRNETFAWWILVWSPVVGALGKIGDPQAVNVLLSTIYHEDMWIRLESAKALGYIDDPLAVNMLLTNLLEDPLSKILSLAVERLSKKEVSGSPIWASFREYRNRQHMTEDVLITMGKQGKSIVVKSLLEALKKKKSRMRRVKKAVFRRSSNRRDITLLMHRLLDKNEDIKLREEAAELLGRIGNIRVVEGLLVCLQEQHLYSKVTSALERLAMNCDPDLFCKRLLHAEARLALDERAHEFIYDLLAQQSPRLRDVAGMSWNHWRRHLMSSTNYVSSQQQRRIFISTGKSKMMKVYLSLMKVQKELPIRYWQNKITAQDDDFSGSKVDVTETVLALIGLKEITIGWLCYLFGWVTGLIFLLLWRKNHFVRFHAMQSILLFSPTSIAMTFLYQYSGPNVLLKIVALFAFICWILLMASARAGKYFKLPLLGIYAKRFADSRAT